MAAPDKTRFWNQAAGTKTFTHPLDHARLTHTLARAARAVCPDFEFTVNDGARLPFDPGSVDAVLLFAVLTCIPDDAAQKILLAEFKRTLRPGGLLLISDYPLQTDARNLERYSKFAQEAGGYGSFRLPEGTLLRHHRRASRSCGAADPLEVAFAGECS